MFVDRSQCDRLLAFQIVIRKKTTTTLTHRIELVWSMLYWTHQLPNNMLKLIFEKPKMPCICLKEYCVWELSIDRMAIEMHAFNGPKNNTHTLSICTNVHNTGNNKAHSSMQWKKKTKWTQCTQEWQWKSDDEKNNTTQHNSNGNADNDDYDDENNNKQPNTLDNGKYAENQLGVRFWFSLFCVTKCPTLSSIRYTWVSVDCVQNISREIK